MNDARKIYKNIKIIRKDQNMNQSILAEFLGIDQTAISRIENDQQHLNVDQIVCMIKLFGLSFDEIINYKKINKKVVSHE